MAFSKFPFSFLEARVADYDKRARNDVAEPCSSNAVLAPRIVTMAVAKQAESRVLNR